MSWNSSVTLVIDYGLDYRGSISGRGREFSSSPPLPDRFWCPPSLQCNRYRRLLSSG